MWPNDLNLQTRIWVGIGQTSSLPMKKLFKITNMAQFGFVGQKGKGTTTGKLINFKYLNKLNTNIITLMIKQQIFVQSQKRQTNQN
jgi:hypothetical protein